MANQLQLLLLLVLTKSNLPNEVIDFLTRNKFASFSLDFINLEDFPGIRIAMNWFEKSQENESLNKIGVESSSTFYNNSALVLLFIILIPLHI